MKLVATAVLAVAALTLALPAAAQDAGSYLGPLSSAAEGFGGGVGQSLMGGDSIFVYAQGHARLATAAPTPPAPSGGYFVHVSFSARTAAEAIGKRDALVERLRQAAGRFKSGVEVSDAAVVLGESCGRTPRGRIDMACMGALQAVAIAPAAENAAPTEPANSKTEFTARATVKIMEPAAGQAAALLDAIHEAGADNIGAEDDANPYVRYRAPSVFNLGATLPADERAWTEAAQNAVRAARAQAALLAQADGRDVGAAKQILLLTRSADGTEATVTVAVRFELAKTKP